jgi:hypothetical protein
VTAASVFAVAEALAPVVAKIPDALEKLAAWRNGGPAPLDVLAELPDVPDLSRGDLELEAMKARAASGSGGASA